MQIACESKISAALAGLVVPSSFTRRAFFIGPWRGPVKAKGMYISVSFASSAFFCVNQRPVVFQFVGMTAMSRDRGAEGDTPSRSGGGRERQFQRSLL